MTKNSIYTLALKFGADNTINGITYNKLLENLKSNNIIIEPEFKKYFHIWFYENFYVGGLFENLKDPKFVKSELTEENLTRYDNNKAIITGQSHLSYLEYQELQFAYKSSKSASRIAISAIIISVVLGAIQIWEAFQQISNNVKSH